MPHSTNIDERISQSYAGLSDKMQVAADYVAENPVDVATRSLRSIASSSGVSPATFSRLARALGYRDYEQLRESGREMMGRKMASFSERAHDLRSKEQPADGQEYLRHQSLACIANIEWQDHNIDSERLEAAVAALHSARSVLLVGSLGSAGIVDYFSYLAHWFSDTWQVAGRNGTTLAGSVARLEPNDVVLAVSKAPYARRTVAAVRSAKQKGAKTVVITDRHSSPSLEFADFAFIVPTESPQFFSSYAATVVLTETIVTMLLAKAGPEAEDMIRAAEEQIDALGETWVG